MYLFNKSKKFLFSLIFIYSSYNLNLYSDVIIKSQDFSLTNKSNHQETNLMNKIQESSNKNSVEPVIDKELCFKIYSPNIFELNSSNYINHSANLINDYLNIDLRGYVDLYGSIVSNNFWNIRYESLILPGKIKITFIKDLN